MPDKRGSILVSTHTPQRTSSAAGETDCRISLMIAVRNAARIPGPGVVVACFSAAIPSAILDPIRSFWGR